jgi:hypothetical protein
MIPSVSLSPACIFGQILSSNHSSPRNFTVTPVDNVSKTENFQVWIEKLPGFKRYGSVAQSRLGEH